MDANPKSFYGYFEDWIDEKKWEEFFFAEIGEISY